MPRLRANSLFWIIRRHEATEAVDLDIERINDPTAWLVDEECSKGDIMGVTKLGAFLGTEWRQLFADSLLKSSPDLNPDAADELSDSQFFVLAALPPEQAVRQYLATEASRRTTTCAPGSDDALQG